MEIIDFPWTCKDKVPQSLTMQSVDSDEPVDKQKLIKIVSKLDKKSKFGLRTKYYIESIYFPIICHRSFKQTRM